MRSECSRAARSDAWRTIGVRTRTPVRTATLTNAYSSSAQNTYSRQTISHTSIALMYDTCSAATEKLRDRKIDPEAKASAVASEKRCERDFSCERAIYQRVEASEI